MVVEDDPAIAQMVSLQLELSGYRTHVERDGLAALDGDPPRPAGRDPPRHRAAGPRRHPGLPPAAVRGRLDADPLRHRPRRRGRPRGRPRARRGRLRHQAVLAARGHRPHRQRAAPHPAPASAANRSASSSAATSGCVPDERRAYAGDDEIAFTATEFDLLAYLMGSPGRVYSREQLMRQRLGLRHGRGPAHRRRARRPGPREAREPRRHPHGPGRRVCGAAAGPRVRSAAPVRKRLRPTLAHADRPAGGLRRGPDLGGRHRHQRQPAPAGRRADRTGGPRRAGRPGRGDGPGGREPGSGPGAGPQGAAVDQRPDRGRAHPRERRAHPRRRPGRRAVAHRRPDAAPLRRASPSPCGCPRDDGILLVEARPTPAGGLVLAQRRGDALALGGQALQQLTISLVVTGLIAAALGLLVAWRLSRPLKRTAAAATAHGPGLARRRDPRGGSARGRRGGRVGEPAGRRAVPLRGPAARVPPLGVPRPAHAADRHHRVCRVAGRRGGPAGPAGRRRDGHRRRGQTPGAPGRRPAGPGPARRDRDADGLRAGRPARRRRRRRRDLAAPLCAGRRGLPRRGHGRRRIVVFADAQRLRQALDGLFENALRVTPQGAPIVVATRTEPGGVGGPRGAGRRPGARPTTTCRWPSSGRPSTSGTAACARSAPASAWPSSTASSTGWAARSRPGHAPEGGARFTIRMPLPLGPGRTEP